MAAIALSAMMRSISSPMIASMCRDHRCERVAVIGIAVQRLRPDHERPPRALVVATLTLTPNSYFLCALPLPMHSTSGACTL